MTPLPLATIVIANYNYARFVGEAIDSALDQTYPRCEVVVVDDGSTDDSRRVIEAYGDRITTVLKPNGGIASALNAGVGASRGDVVLWLGSDDTLFPEAVERTMPVFDEPGVAQVHFPLHAVDSDGRSLGFTFPHHELSRGDLRDLVLREGPGCYTSRPAGGAWSRSFLTEVVPIPEADFARHADAYLVDLAPLYGIVERVPEPLGRRRLHGDNVTGSRPVADQVHRSFLAYEARCLALARAALKLGLRVEPQAWRREESVYSWLRDSSTALGELEALVPPGSSYILVDENNWMDARGGAHVLWGRCALPFLERDGEWWGQPADGAQAIAELERLRTNGASLIAFVWPAFWWLEHYADFASYLCTRYPCLLANDRLVVFDLTGP